MMTERKAWECPRCGRMNAPHTDHCDCGPATEPVSIPTIWPSPGTTNPQPTWWWINPNEWWQPAWPMRVTCGDLPGTIGTSSVSAAPYVTAGYYYTDEVGIRRWMPASTLTSGSTQ